nr:hypothetical protein CFP56_01241 [Quercus suber]
MVDAAVQSRDSQHSASHFVGILKHSTHAVPQRQPRTNFIQDPDVMSSLVCLGGTFEEDGVTTASLRNHTPVSTAFTRFPVQKNSGLDLQPANSPSHNHLSTIKMRFAAVSAVAALAGVASAHGHSNGTWASAYTTEVERPVLGSKLAQDADHNPQGRHCLHHLLSRGYRAYPRRCHLHRLLGMEVSPTRNTLRIADSISQASTVTITNCPCTIIKPVTSSVVTSCATCAPSSGFPAPTGWATGSVGTYPSSYATAPTYSVPSPSTGAPSSTSPAASSQTTATNGASSVQVAGLLVGAGALAALVLNLMRESFSHVMVNRVESKREKEKEKKLRVHGTGSGTQGQPLQPHEEQEQHPLPMDPPLPQC